jgi:hypothetical protein
MAFRLLEDCLSKVLKYDVLNMGLVEDTPPRKAKPKQNNVMISEKADQTNSAGNKTHMLLNCWRAIHTSKFRKSQALAIAPL